MLNISNIEILAALAKVKKIAVFHIFAICYILLSDIAFHRVVFLKLVENTVFRAKKRKNKKFFSLYVSILLEKLCFLQVLEKQRGETRYQTIGYNI